jgi:hypothetical protein
VKPTNTQGDTHVSTDGSDKLYYNGLLIITYFILIIYYVILITLIIYFILHSCCYLSVEEASLRIVLKIKVVLILILTLKGPLHSGDPHLCASRSTLRSSW